MKKTTPILIATALILTLTAFKVISAEEATAAVTPESTEVKSVAWYVANVKEAKAKNQLCYDNPGKLPNEDCENSLHALQISFKGGN